MGGGCRGAVKFCNGFRKACLQHARRLWVVRPKGGEVGRGEWRDARRPISDLKVYVRIYVVISNVYTQADKNLNKARFCNTRKTQGFCNHHVNIMPLHVNAFTWGEAAIHHLKWFYVGKHRLRGDSMYCSDSLFYSFVQCFSHVISFF